MLKVIEVLSSKPIKGETTIKVIKESDVREAIQKLKKIIDYESFCLECHKLDCKGSSNFHINSKLLLNKIVGVFGDEF